MAKAKRMCRSRLSDLVIGDNLQHHSLTNSIDMKAYLELSDKGASSHKFYEVETKGPSLFIRYGRIGTEGSSSEKHFPSAAEVSKEAKKKIDAKRKKGYLAAKEGVRKKKAVATPKKPSPKSQKGIKLVKEHRKRDTYARICENPGMVVFGKDMYVLEHRQCNNGRSPAKRQVGRNREELKKITVSSEEGRWDEGYEAKLIWLIENWEKLGPKIRKAAFALYTERYEEKKQFTPGEFKYSFLPEPKKASVVDDLFTVTDILLTESCNCFALAGECTWDDEHGWGAVLSRTKVLGFGYACESAPSEFA